MRRSEYLRAAREFRSHLAVESMKPEGEQVWPEMEDWLSVPGTSTCTTPSCEAFGEPFPVTLYENMDGIHRGQCGVCLQPTVPVPVLEDD